MAETNFDIKKANQLYYESNMDGYKYITKYFVPLTNGQHAILKSENEETYTIKDNNSIKQVYFNRLHEGLQTYYFKTFTEIRNLQCKLNIPALHENEDGKFINICPKMKHEYVPYETIDENIKQKVNIMLSFIKEVINNNNNECYNYLIKWLANMVKGNKNDSCIYLKGAQGLGKSTLPEFFRYHVIGEDLSLETGSEPLVSNFNNILEGKLMVFFEELENFSVNQWTAISSKLKRYITSNKITIENKGVNRYETDNINNYFILSNNDAIRDDDGRRYFICDISTKYKQNKAYFGTLRKECFNDVVGRAFYCYLMDVDTSGFIPQDFPTTQSKLDSIAKRLEVPYQYLKDEYVLKSKAINAVVVGELYKDFLEYCKSNSKKSMSKIDFNKKLSEIGIEYYKSNKENKFNVPLAQLQDIATKNNWIHELDDVVEDFQILAPSHNMVTDMDMLKNQLKEKDEEIQRLKAQIQQLMAQPVQVRVEEVVEEVLEQVVEVEQVVDVEEVVEVEEVITPSVIVQDEIVVDSEDLAREILDDLFDETFIEVDAATLDLNTFDVEEYIWDPVDDDGDEFDERAAIESLTEPSHENISLSMMNEIMRTTDTHRGYDLDELNDFILNNL